MCFERGQTPLVTAARDALLAHIRWSGGHADVWRVFADGDALASGHLVESTGATFAGVSLLVDQLGPAVRTTLGRVTALVGAGELGDQEQ